MTLTNAITTAILNYLNYSGHLAWRENNNAVYDPTRKVFRRSKSFTPLGIGDICFIEHGTGIHCEIEIKTGKDRQRINQKKREFAVNFHGGKYFLVYDIEHFQEIAKREGWTK